MHLALVFAATLLTVAPLPRRLGIVRSGSRRRPIPPISACAWYGKTTTARSLLRPAPELVSRLTYDDLSIFAAGSMAASISTSVGSSRAMRREHVQRRVSRTRTSGCRLFFVFVDHERSAGQHADLRRPRRRLQRGLGTRLRVRLFGDHYANRTSRLRRTQTSFNPFIWRVPDPEPGQVITGITTGTRCASASTPHSGSTASSWRRCRSSALCLALWLGHHWLRVGDGPAFRGRSEDGKGWELSAGRVHSYRSTRAWRRRGHSPALPYFKTIVGFCVPGGGMEDPVSCSCRPASSSDPI